MITRGVNRLHKSSQTSQMISAASGVMDASGNPAPLPPQKPEIPFGAVGVTDKGEAVYAGGLKGWAQRTYANIFNPSTFMTRPTAQQTAMYNVLTPAFEQKIENLTNWDEWGGKWFGISSKQLAESASAWFTSTRETNKEGEITGESVGKVVQQIAEVSIRGATQGIWSALGLLQAGDWAVRHGIVAPGVAFGEMISEKGAPGGSWLEDTKAPAWLKGLTTPLWKVKWGDITLEDWGDAEKSAEASGSFIYSLMVDDAKMQDYQRRYESGDNPALLKIELQNPWWELAGSILDDPLTYVGATVPMRGGAILGIGAEKAVVEADKAAMLGKAAQMAASAEDAKGLWGVYSRFISKLDAVKLKVFGPWEMRQVIPSLGDILHLGLGTTRVENEARMLDAVSSELPFASKLKDAKTDEEALSLIKDWSKTESTSISAMDGWINGRKAVIADVKYTAGTLAADQRAVQAGRRSSLVFQAVMTQSKDPFSLLTAAFKMVNGTEEEKIWAFARLCDEPIGRIFFSDSGRDAMIYAAQFQGDVDKFMNGQKAFKDVASLRSAGKKIPADLQKIADSFSGKFGDTKEKQLIGIATYFSNKSEQVAEKMMPSVTEMKKAAKAVKDGSTDAYDIALAEKYDGKIVNGVKQVGLPEYVKITNNVNEAIAPSYNWIKNKFINLWFGWQPGPSTRNIGGQFIPILLDMGIGTAVEATTKGLLGMENAGATRNIVDANAEVIRRFLGGMEPEGMWRGIGAIGDVAGGGKRAPGLKWMGRGEEIAASVIMRDVVTTGVMEKGSQVLPEVAKVLKGRGLSETQIGAVLGIVRDEAYSADRALPRIYKLFDGGQLETWRFIEPGPEFHTYLNKTGQLDAFNKLRWESQSPQDFEAGVNDILRGYEDTMVRSAMRDAELGTPLGLNQHLGAGTDTDPTKLVEAVTEVQKAAQAGDTQILYEELELGSKSINQWANTRVAADDAGHKVFAYMAAELRDRGLPESSVADVMTKIKFDFDQKYRQYANVNDYLIKSINKIKDGEITDLTTWWRTTGKEEVLTIDGIKFTLPNLFPDVPAGSLTRRDAIDYAYRALYRIETDGWLIANTKYIDDMASPNGEMATFAKRAINMNWDDVVGAIVKPDQLNPFETVVRERAQAVVFQEAWQSARLKGNITYDIRGGPKNLVEAVRSLASKRYNIGSDKGDIEIINAINAHLPEHYDKIVTLEDIPDLGFANTALSKSSANINRGAIEDFRAILTKELKKLPHKESADKWVENLRKMSDKGASAKDVLKTATSPEFMDALKKGAKLRGETQEQFLQEILDAMALEKSPQLDHIPMRRTVLIKPPKTSKDMVAEVAKWGTKNARKPEEIIIGNVHLTVSDYHGRFVVNNILSTDQQKGEGTAVLKRLVQLSDESGVDIDLMAQAIPTGRGMNQEQLVAWYEKNGFVKSGELNMMTHAAVKPAEEGLSPIAQKLADLGNDPAAARGLTAVNPYIQGNAPSTAQALNETLPHVRQQAAEYVKTMKEQWGATEDVLALTADQQQGVETFMSQLKDRMNTVYRVVGAEANLKRDFILHSYLKSYADLFTVYALPFQYWQSRTYVRFFERIAQDPRIAVVYLRYRQLMEKLHSTLPDWWKYNIPIKFWPGASDPLYFNVESTLNPVYGFTGVDFNDPYKRVDWISSVVDDLGKFGPSTFVPIQWAVAAHLYAKGETQAAQRWMGRALPQSVAIKSALNLVGAKVNLGPFIRNNEVDPFVNFLDNNGLDPYEETRVGRALSSMEQQGLITEAQGDDASRLHSGDIWDMAVQRATAERAPGNIASWFLGFGFKPRTAGDMATDQFYEDYFKLLAAQDTMSADNYRRSWTALRDQYPFMDTILIGRKSGPERDTAYAYAVLSRIPPGQMTDMLESIGVTSDYIDKFYTAKGKWTDWNTQDKDRFMAGIADVAAVMNVPETATRQEWDAAKSAYITMKTQVQKLYGESIYDAINLWYEQPDSLKDSYMAAHPEISDAMDAQNKIINNTPLLSKYYGGIGTIQRYWTSMMYHQLDAKYGTQVQDLWDEYYKLQLKDAANGTKTASPFFKAHPVLKKYMADRDSLQAQVYRKVSELGAKLPEGPTVNLRTDLGVPSLNQQNLISAAQPTKQRTWQEWQQVLDPDMQSLIIEFFNNPNSELPAPVLSTLDYMAKDLGYPDGKSALQAVGVSLRSATP